MVLPSMTRLSSASPPCGDSGRKRCYDLQQVDQVFQGHEVVYRHQFQFGAVQDDLQGGPADASHAVNGDFSHGFLLYFH